jgi:4-amino-4-deoxy-L-arabinose transferase-like glycosyltransferase
MLTISPARAVACIIGITAILRVAFALSLGLGVDESYTVATGRLPQLSYFDHPPLAWWLAWGGARLFGEETALAVRLPFIAAFALTTWFMFAVTKRLFGEKAGLWAALTLNCAPALAWTSGTWLLPDGPLNLGLMASCYCLVAALFGAAAAAPLWWLAAGACAGIAMMSKLHGLFLPAGVFLFLATSKRYRHWLLSPWPYAAAIVALLVFAPAIVWNAGHEWMSFTFQAGRAHGLESRPLAPLLALAQQAIYLLPWLWLPLVLCLTDALRRGPQDERQWLLACLAIGPIAAFTLVAAGGARTFPHWAMPGYLLAFPLLGARIAQWLERAQRQATIWLSATVASVALILAAVVGLSYAPWPLLPGTGYPVLRYPLEEALDWTDLVSALKERQLLGSPGLLVAGTRWLEAGKIDYALRGEMPVICICTDARGYGVLPAPTNELDADVLIVGRNLPMSSVQRLVGGDFSKIDELAPVSITHAGRPVFELSLYFGHNFRPRWLAANKRWYVPH